ncbi:glycosyltransferase family 4 protein [Olsenella profusa]|uniref:Glycosyltransferase family 4 protein n=1 Tax=Olsenella profusa TaxID=138595 RepID=A0ABS2F3B2_9ACTN|nr:glycosyltransferase family 4 protein [Olsenella profusa]MBM6775484.1 glycosyltransferase family 4 protein [Olsenella profusa]
MKVFFATTIQGNTGPANANRGFFESWPEDDEVRRVSGRSKASKAFSAIRGALWCDVVVSFGPGPLDNLISAVVAARRVPRVGFCHGYAPFENEINRMGRTDREMGAYVDWLDGLDVVATNSDLQKRFIETRQPSLKGKIEVTLLGVNPFPSRRRSHSKTGRIVVSVSGGTRPIKGNDVVARAVALMRERGRDAELRVYGDRYAENSHLDQLVKSCGSYREQLPKEEFLAELGETDVFVMDSRHESFGLSAVDALSAGCSLLISSNCGVKEILGVEGCDLVSDCEDAGEVAGKISYLAEHPNNERLCRSIDFDACSWAAAAARLREACAHALKKKVEFGK